MKHGHALDTLARPAMLMALLWACGDEGEPAKASDPAPSEADGEYPFEVGPNMFPGQNCRSCHGGPSSPYPEAPDWSFAGTVFEGPDSDRGAPGVTVTVVDATGAKAQAVTNEVGNFYASTPLVAPYSVSLSKGDASISMAVFPPAGGCNACHASQPVGGAPGRLYLPEGAFESKAVCDGEQTVSVDGTKYDCHPYRCDAERHACLTTCDTDAECAEGASCSDGRCSEAM